MKAASNAETEFAMGREPTETSQPAPKSRDPSCYKIMHCGKLSCVKKYVDAGCLGTIFR
jgi:hypothetical protein